jgi:Holliday junction resolvase RusA-like endonuclease
MKNKNGFNNLRKKTKEKPVFLEVKDVKNPQFGIFPPSALVLFNHFIESTQNYSLLKFSLNSLPPTVNHMYINNFARGKKILTKETIDFRTSVNIAIKSQKGYAAWRPQGIVIAMIFLESPLWISKKKCVRSIDGDNRLKPLFDAVQKSVGLNDAVIWEAHYWKVYSTQTRTTVYLFDAGNIVEHYNA